MDDDLLRASVYLVGLDLPDVVGDVVDRPKLPVGMVGTHRFLEGLADPVGDRHPVDEGEVRRRRHSMEIALPLRRVPRHADQLPVGELDPILPDGALHVADIVRAHLVSISARATVDLHRDVPQCQPEGLRRLLVVDLVDLVDLQEVVPRSKGPHLLAAPLLGPLADLGGVGAVDPAELLGAA